MTKELDIKISDEEWSEIAKTKTYKDMNDHEILCREILEKNGITDRNLEKYIFDEINKKVLIK